MSNIQIKHLILDKWGAEVRRLECDVNRLSFFFDNGNNWHFEIKSDDTEEDLLARLLGTAELITKRLLAKSGE